LIQAYHRLRQSDCRQMADRTFAYLQFLRAYQLTGQSRFLQASLNNWRFVQANLIDRQHGDWFWSVSSDGSLQSREKTGSWKTPYHNGRACLKIRRRIDSIVGRIPSLSIGLTQA
jgi:mannose/cellobiose epimerase-like protein (N-acyl-D-glucosamine 2-epimerase family)